MEDDVVKVQGVGLPEAALVAGVDLHDPGHPPVLGGGGLLGEAVGALVLVLGVADDGEHRAGSEVLLVQAHVLDDIPDDPLAVLAVVDGKGAGETQVQPLDVPPEDADAGGVEGSGPDVLGGGAAHVLQTVLELPRGLVGEGDGDDGPGCGGLQGAEAAGTHPVLRGGLRREGLQKGQVLLPRPLGHLRAVGPPAEGQEVVHPVDEYRGLPAPRPGEEEQGALGGEHGLLLAGVQMPVAPGDHGAAGGGIALFKVLSHVFSISLPKI